MAPSSPLIALAPCIMWGSVRRNDSMLEEGVVLHNISSSSLVQIIQFYLLVFDIIDTLILKRKYM